MKIAYVVTRADAVGGATIHVRDMAAAMLKRGHEVTVLVGGEGLVTEQLRAAGVPHRSLLYLQRSISPPKDVRAAAELRHVLQELRPDLVSTHTSKAGWIGRAVARRLHVPVLYTPHGWTVGDRISGRSGRVFTLAERIAARWSDAIVCVCDYERRLALEKRIAEPDRLRVIYNGVRDVPVGLRATPGRTPVRIVSVARLEAPKDHETLLRALAELRELAWTLELVGDGPLEGRIRELATELGLTGRVIFSGYRPDPAEALAQAQLFVLSSGSEAFPRSILEAMRAALPVVASDVGGVAEAVADGRSGRLVAKASPPALAEALKAFIKNDLDRQLAGVEGRRMYERRFTFDAMARATEGLYATIVGQRRTSLP